MFQEVCVIYLAVEINNNKLTPLNTVGLVIILIGISIHVIMKARQKVEIIMPKHNLNSDDTLANRLNFEPKDSQNESQKENDADHGDEIELFSANKKSKKSLFNFNGIILNKSRSKSESFSMTDQQNEPLLNNDKN